MLDAYDSEGRDLFLVESKDTGKVYWINRAAVEKYYKAFHLLVEVAESEADQSGDESSSDGERF